MRKGGQTGGTMEPVTIIFAAMAAVAVQDKDVPASAVMPPAPPPMITENRPSGPNRQPTPTRDLASVIYRHDYPAAALREGRSGRTSVELAVTRWGTVADCRVTASSGHADLDAASCDRLATRARFWPATDAAGRDIAGTYVQSVRWALPEDAGAVGPPVPPPIVAVAPIEIPKLFPAPPRVQNYGWQRVATADWPPAALAEKRGGKARISFDLDPAGKVAGCRVIESSGHADLDAASCAIATQRASFKPALGVDGQPISGRVEQVLAWRVPDEATPSSPKARVPAYTPQATVLPPFLITDGRARLVMTLGKDGKARECRLEAGGSMAGIAAMQDRLCKEARERGFRVRDAARTPLPLRIEAVLEIKAAAPGK